MRRMTLWVRVAAVAAVGLTRAVVRRLRTGPTLPSWTWAEELFVAVYRSVLTTASRDVERRATRPWVTHIREGEGCSDRPESGRLGDNLVIEVWFQPLPPWRSCAAQVGPGRRFMRTYTRRIRPPARIGGSGRGGDVRREGRLLIAVVAVTAWLGGVPAMPAAADPPPRIVSHHEIESSVCLRRDGGYSVPLSGTLAGNSLWLFGDGSTTPTPCSGPGFFLPGTWGAVGPSAPGTVPIVSEIPPPGTPIDPSPNGRGPSSVLPVPTGLRWPDGRTACGGQDASYHSYAASWPMGATVGPAGRMTLHTDGSSTPITVDEGSQLVFIAVPEVCVVASKDDVPLTPPRGFEALDDRVWSEWPDMVIQRQKLVAYSPGCAQVAGRQVCNEVVASMTLFRTTNGTALPWTRFLLNPVFANGHLYLNAHKCDDWAAGLGACVQGRVTTVRAPVESLHDPATYRWYQSPGTWGAEATAASVLPATANGGAILTDTHDFRSVDEGFLLMQQWHFGGGYQLWQAPSPAGPWTLKREGVIPGCQSGTASGCYALVGHPELSTRDNIVYTFHDRSDGFVKISSVGTIP
jgi:hypothetical protein